MLHNLLGLWRASDPRPDRGQERSARSCRLRLECLEDRAVPATLNVTTTLDVVDPADGKRSLREAITQANNNPGADVIVLPVGVYKLALAGADENVNASGDLDVRGAVTIRGAGAGLTIIDGQQLDRVFDIFGAAPSSIKIVLQGLTLRNGLVTGHGGGIRVGNADLVVRDCVVTGNRASLSGGGMSNGTAPGTGNVTLVRTTVGRNVAGAHGGGLGVFGSSLLTVKDSTARRNLASASGGGIRADTATLTDSTVSGNSAGFGGGIIATTATLTNSTVSGNSATDSGGGINAGTATLTNSTVSGNSAASDGGGIKAFTANLTNSTVSGNTADGNGGGIRATTAATLTNSSVSGNSAVFNGGGIDATTATLTGSTVSGNTADGNGGGINAGTATLTNSTVRGNSADGDGGGILAPTATLSNSTVSGNSTSVSGGGIRAFTELTLTNSTVSGNNAGDFGGGIRANTANLTNSTVSGNTAGTNGGGIHATTANLLNCTIVENIAQTGGGVFHDPGGTFSVKNTLIALNLVGFTGAGPDVSGDFASQGHNLIGDGAGGTGFTNGVNGDQVGTSVNPIDPKIGALMDNGGRTKTHALLAGSRAIDAGDNAAAPATDQRGPGFPRKKDGNGDGVKVVDIGAFER